GVGQRMSVALGFESPHVFSKAVRTMQANGLRGLTMREVAALCLQQAGVAVPMGDPQKLFAAAVGHSSSDFPLLLQDAMHKTLLAGMEVQEYSWPEWCEEGSSTDFKLQNVYRMIEAGYMELIVEGKTPDEQTFGE